MAFEEVYLTAIQARFRAVREPAEQALGLAERGTVPSDTGAGYEQCGTVDPAYDKQYDVTLDRLFDDRRGKAGPQPGRRVCRPGA